MYRLLIVDDEAIERDALRYIVEKSELPIEAIEEAANGQEAVSAAALFEPDIIVMDIRMPGLDGIESSRIIKKIKANTKIIFLTAFDEFDHAKAGIELGIEAFLVKPASRERVTQVLAETIEVLAKERKRHEDMAEVEEKLHQMSRYLESEFLTSVVSGNLSEDQLAEYKEFLSIRGNFGFGLVISLYYDFDARESDLRRQMLKKRITEKLKTKTSVLKGKVFVANQRDRIYLLFLSETKELCYEEQDRAKAIVTGYGEEVQEAYQVNMDFGIGDVKEGLKNLWQSFTAAKNSSQKKVLESQSNVEAELLPQVVRCVLDCDEARVKDRIEGLVGEILSGTEDMDTLRVRLYDFIILFNQSVYEETPLRLQASEEIFRQVMAIKTVGSLQTFLQDYFHSVMEGVRELRSDKTVVIMDKLITYINSHYNENITLEQLAAISGFSSFYLSKVFKRHVDMNFSDYLTFIRIKVAKRMLKNPAKSIKEISMEVGYPDPNYFARVFRKMEQMTPTEYRNRYMEI